MDIVMGLMELKIGSIVSLADVSEMSRVFLGLIDFNK